MHRVLALYSQPRDPEHFRDYYVNTHVPIANKLPGLRGFRYSFDVGALGGGSSPYFCIAELDFDSAEALMAALNSEEGKATAGDVPNYATGGAVLLHYEMTDAR